MSGKLIEMHHKVCDYTCMWNGLEDLYERRTGTEVPDYFFFCLSGIGNFVYLKSNTEIPRRAAWNDGRTKKMYQSICDTVGFSFRHIEGRTFDYALRKAKEQIDRDLPVILGCLDMYYLSYYPKFYHQNHIPIHYILMVGYDDKEECVLVQDCGLPGVQKLWLRDLEKALDIKKTELSDKNSICIVDFPGDVKSIGQIAEEIFPSKAAALLKTRVGFVGIPGMRKLAREFEGWQKELTEDGYKASLEWLIEFTGEVPLLPMKLLGQSSKDDIRHCALRDRFGNLLIDLEREYGITDWAKAGKLFLESGDILQKMTDMIVEYLLDYRKKLSEIPEMINRIADTEEMAYRILAERGRNEKE